MKHEGGEYEMKNKWKVISIALVVMVTATLCGCITVHTDDTGIKERWSVTPTPASTAIWTEEELERMHSTPTPIPTSTPTTTIIRTPTPVPTLTYLDGIDVARCMIGTVFGEDLRESLANGMFMYAYPTFDVFLAYYVERNPIGTRVNGGCGIKGITTVDYYRGMYDEWVSMATPYSCIPTGYYDGKCSMPPETSLIEYLTEFSWSEPYQRGTWDCSQMSAAMECSLERCGYDTRII